MVLNLEKVLPMTSDKKDSGMNPKKERRENTPPGDVPNGC